MMGGLGTPAAAGTHPITVRTNDRADAAAGHGGTPPAHPAAATPHDDDGSDMEDDVAAPPSASARSDASSPVDDDTGPAPEREVEGAAPAGEAICGDGSDDVDMGRDDNPGKQSNACQFYIVCKEQGLPQLDSNYMVFGMLIKGGDVLEAIEKEKTNTLDQPDETIPLDVSIQYYSENALLDSLGFKLP